MTVEPASPLYQYLHAGDTITRVGVDCDVRSLDDMGSCFEQMHVHTILSISAYTQDEGLTGVCLSNSIIESRNTAERWWLEDVSAISATLTQQGVIACCGARDNGSQKDALTRFVSDLVLT